MQTTRSSIDIDAAAVPAGTSMFAVILTHFTSGTSPCSRTMVRQPSDLWRARQRQAGRHGTGDRWHRVVPCRSTKPRSRTRSGALSQAKWRWAASGQLDRLEDVFDDDLVFVHLTGNITSKSEWMRELRSRRFVYDHIEPLETSVRALTEDVAVVVARGAFTVNGGLVFPLVCTEVYAKRNGRWKLVTLHACSDST